MVINIDDVFNENLVFFEVDVSSKDEAFQKISEFALSQNRVSSKEAYYKGLWERENLSTTGFGNGFSIPHAKIKEVKLPSIIFCKFVYPIEWKALDDQPVSVSLALAIPEASDKNHLKILSTLARGLMNEEFKNKLGNSTTKSDVVSSINQLFTQIS